MQLDELKIIIKAAGGREFALDYAEALLDKLNRVEASQQYEPLIRQLRSAKEQGDFRGRVLEVNFADHFVTRGLQLEYGAKQGMNGDVDFCWNIVGRKVFIEMKLLGQYQKIRDSINQQLETTGVSSTFITDDTRDVARIQFDMFQKSSTKKFNPKPEKQWINLIGVDVSELQLGTVDVCDCLLAAGGNEFASKHCDPACLREAVVGVFERLVSENMSAAQKGWVDGIHKMAGGAPHPRDYIHGALFLFREPKERAALNYTLSAALVWNPALVTEDVAREIAAALHRVIPLAK